MRKEKKNSLMAQETISVSLGPFFVLPHAILLLVATCVIFIFVPHVPVSCSSFIIPLSIVPHRWLLAPAIHPTSSGLQG